MLKTRILTALVLLPSFLAALFYIPETYWAMLALAMVAVGLWEWAGLVRFSSATCTFYVLAAVAGGLFFLSADEEVARSIELSAITLSAIFWIFAAPFWLMSRHQFKSPAVLAFLGWLVVMPAGLALIGLRRIDPWLLLAVMATVWVADSAAYFFGKRFGKHKLAPQISPGKTWEGVWGAGLAVTIYGVILSQIFSFSLWLIVGMWAITVLSIMGDLLESLIKRQVGAKDSGNLLPGHGGVLDRIDGLTSTLPLTAFFIYFPLYFDMLLHH